MNAVARYGHLLVGRRQGGMVSVIALMILISIVTLIAVMTLRVADTGINDSLNQSSNVAALFLAESGLQYATQQLSSGSETCGAMAATSQSVGRGSFTISTSATTSYDGITALAAGQCRVQVSGKVSNSDITRTVQGIINYNAAAGGVALDSSTSITRNYDDNFTFPVTVGVAGTNRLLAVGVALHDSGQTVSSISYPGVTATQKIVATGGTGSSKTRVELWLLTAPATGTNNVQVVLSGGKTGVVAGAISLTGVDQTVPVEALQQNNGSSNSPSIAINTTSNNDWVVDILGFLQSTPTPSAGAGQAQAWNVATGGSPSSRVRGAGSTLGPNSPAGSVTMSWSLSGSARDWAMAAAAIKPAPSAGIGVVSWREMVF